jgi:hypothetical protein
MSRLRHGMRRTVVVGAGAGATIALLVLLLVWLLLR